MSDNVKTIAKASSPGADDQAWERLKQRLYVGQQLQGVVQDVQPYGVFLDIGEAYPAFIDAVDAPSTSLSVGDERWLRIIQFADWNRQIRVKIESILKGLDAGIATSVEGEYLKFKEVYDRLSDDERRVLRSALRTIAEASELLRPGLTGNFRVPLEYVEEYYDETGEVAYSNFGRFMPKIAIQAIDAWDRGEDFFPTSFWRLLTTNDSATKDTTPE